MVEAMANGVQTTLMVYCIAAVFLSLETFELAFLLFFIGAQLPTLVDDQRADEELVGSRSNEVPESTAAPVIRSPV